MYKPIEPRIENTFFEARVDENGNTISYRIRPKTGYHLHEITLDGENEDGEKLIGFTESYITAGANYDFEKNERQIYAVSKEYF